MPPLAFEVGKLPGANRATSNFPLCLSKLGCVWRNVPSQTSDGPGDAAKNTAISTMIRSAFVVPFNEYDWIWELEKNSSVGIGGTAYVAASAIVGAST